MSCDLTFRIFRKTDTPKKSICVVSLRSLARFVTLFLCAITVQIRVNNILQENGHRSSYRIYRFLGYRRHWSALCRPQGAESRVSYKSEEGVSERERKGKSDYMKKKNTSKITRPATTSCFRSWSYLLYRSFVIECCMDQWNYLLIAIFRGI